MDAKELHIVRMKMLCKDLVEYYGKGQFCLNFEDMGWGRGGTASYRGGRIFIKMNINYISQKPEEQVLNAILHEIAHGIDYTIRGTSYHSEIWRKIAIGIGCDGKTCYEGRLKPLGMIYVYKCPNCGDEMEQNWKRGPKSAVACGDCCNEYNKGDYDEKYDFELVNSYINS